MYHPYLDYYFHIQMYYYEVIFMANFDYFKNYVDHLERYNQLEAHEQHILEFKAMCA